MKIVVKCLFVSLLMILISCNSGSPKNSNIIGKPFKISNLEVVQKDFPNVMNWNDAKEACAELGDGWRLPTKDELNILYHNKDKIGGFADGYYWSSTEFDNNYAWYQNFYNGFQDYFYKNVTMYVRAIRAF
jgi:formylglycine-generating enzyme required for sulfatase activity